ncbi:hypothetical protein AX14_009394 [Amanita brunnescens Koide BX004]|nr:hypothetical protein AX14_009394 [Amanita brunnescens Koide BX004]
MTKRHSKRVPQLRSRQTRSSKGRTLLSDPAENTQALNQQLTALGLYAVQTLGDGNCLFRALSDQYYGSDSKHAQVRQDICDWIATHHSRYAPFVDDERGIDTHLRCMRQHGTYGGHMELSAFAHFTQRNIKVIQPGLVYVIEWNAGGDPDDALKDNGHTDDNPADARERRKQRRERIKEKKHAPPTLIDDEHDDSLIHSTIYVAYHDWEHFSSIRNLIGPHAGLPYVQEAPVGDTDATPPSKHAQKANVKRVKLKVVAPSTSSSSCTSPKSIKPPSKGVSSKEDADPVAFPLPGSRTPSPSPPLSALSSLSPSPAPYPPLYAQPEASTGRASRSPKRNFVESSDSIDAEDGGDEYGSEAGPKRARLGSHARGQDKSPMAVDDASDDGEVAAVEEEEAPRSRTRAPVSNLSEASSFTSLSSITSSSSSSPSPPPPTYRKQSRVSEQRKQIQRRKSERPLTRRQQGLIDKKSKKSAGVIVIPPGKRGGNAKVGAEEENAEWLRNGNGRVDVRGFRELRI